MRPVVKQEPISRKQERAGSGREGTRNELIRVQMQIQGQIQQGNFSALGVNFNESYSEIGGIVSPYMDMRPSSKYCFTI